MKSTNFYGDKTERFDNYTYGHVYIIKFICSVIYFLTIKHLFMAESTDNVLTRGLRGSFGKQMVFRQKHGRTYVAKPPRKRSGELTDRQKAQQERFTQATLYWAKIKNTDVRQEYENAAGDGLSAYNIAVSDTLNAPAIEDIDISQYTGLANQVIRVVAHDNFKVKEVTVTIENGDGTFVEEGNATSQDGINWVYTTTAPNESLSGDRITVGVIDNPDNLTEKDVVLP